MAVCCASRIKPRKIADQAIFCLANCVRSPTIVGFYGFFNEKSHKNLQVQQAPRAYKYGKSIMRKTQGISLSSFFC
jgi:hypothetical protein